ncbi:primase-helicase family protein [Antarctobacter sp.]|uniref:primase-helicase family protein n=1 Tax=Antarctobacter sp. TaxID=1872577 RepID=UPI002B2728D1|nr:primase-helicase family protein [Antarctobacter sp.]
MTDEAISDDDNLVDVLGDTEACELSDEDDLPSLTRWQEIVLERHQKDMLSGVAWHPATRKPPTAKKPTAENRRDEIRMELASWFVSSDNKFIKVDDPESRLGLMDLPKVAVPMLHDFYHDTPFAPQIEKNSYDLVQACIEAAPADPRMSFGPWSGKTYPAPGNPSNRLYRNNLWDINSWSKPDYRQHQEASDFGAFQPFLNFAIADEKQQTMLLDWIAWSLQHEAEKPNWAILLFSEEKGTGKSTIGVVLEALFGAANTAKLDGVDKLVAKHADRVLDKKLIIAEEVHISSHSPTGNKLKDLITSDRTTVEPKYQPTKTIPIKACFLFTTNHKPLWLEGGERRYYIIEMSHEGHAQGPRSDDFTDLVGDVMEQISEPEKLAALYAAFMHRQISPAFNSKSMKFQENATPIMQELQALSGNENDETLEALLAEFKVSIIPSADFRSLAKYVGARNDNSLRNALVRLGWEDDRLRWDKRQQRIWRKKDLLIQDGRVHSSDLAATLDGAVENGFEWFPLLTFINSTWKTLLENKLDRSLLRDRDSFNSQDHSEEPGPFLDSCSHSSYRNWQQSVGVGANAAGTFLRVEDDLQ